MFIWVFIYVITVLFNGQYCMILPSADRFPVPRSPDLSHLLGYCASRKTNPLPTADFPSRVLDLAVDVTSHPHAHENPFPFLSRFNAPSGQSLCGEGHNHQAGRSNRLGGENAERSCRTSSLAFGIVGLDIGALDSFFDPPKKAVAPRASTIGIGAFGFDLPPPHPSGRHPDEGTLRRQHRRPRPRLPYRRRPPPRTNAKRKGPSGFVATMDRDLVAPRGLAPSESAALRARLKSRLRVDDGDEAGEEDAEVLLDYAEDMIESGETCGHIAEEVRERDRRFTALRLIRERPHVVVNFVPLCVAARTTAHSCGSWRCRCATRTPPRSWGSA